MSDTLRNGSHRSIDTNGLQRTIAIFKALLAGFRPVPSWLRPSMSS
jgi:hypothetical protein